MVTEDMSEQRPYWFVGASYGSTNDQTARFLREGIWENGYQLEGDGRYFDLVNAMQPGDRIATKSTYTQKNGLPFDNQGLYASTMAIKAVGTIRRNLGDGCRVEVDWTPVNPHRKWYFYTIRATVWQVRSGEGTIPWASDELIRFAFENKPQDYRRFLEQWGRPVDDAKSPAPTDESENPTTDDFAPDRQPTPPLDLETEDDEPPPPPPPQDPWSHSNIATLANKLLWDPPSKLQEIIDDRQEKRQVIFYGPPGTGKTYVAQEIAKQCRLNGGDFEIVQFHPSYSYEDFVEGFRPKLIGTQAGFELVQGPLRRIADRARNNPDATCILVIDELNRGNVAKVFGELYFLLEYRDEEVRLQYGGDGQGFSLPKNLWFICTMNTADRSIALMDAALRRRFYFAPFFPNEQPIQGLLGRWLEREGQDTLAAKLVDEANKNLDRHAGIGPSYFMRPGQDLDEPTVRRIWDRAVIPYIEEQCFGDEEKLARFGFDRLKGQVSSGGSPNDAQLDGTDQSEGGDADPNAG